MHDKKGLRPEDHGLHLEIKPDYKRKGTPQSKHLQRHHEAKEGRNEGETSGCESSKGGQGSRGDPKGKGKEACG